MKASVSAVITALVTTSAFGLVSAPAQAAGEGPAIPTVAVSATGFSPNADGRQDTLGITYETHSDGVLALVITTPTGDYEGARLISEADSTEPLGLKRIPAGAGSYAWDGDLNNGSPVKNGSHLLHVTVLRFEGTDDCTDESDSDCYAEDASDGARVRIVRSAPSITIKVADDLYPEHDGYRDRVKLSAKLSNASGSQFVLTASSGKKVRGWKGGAASWSTNWNGKDAGGHVVEEGRYTLTATVNGLYGTAATSKSISVKVKPGRAVRKTARRVLVPDDRAYQQLSGGCSGVYAVGSGREIFDSMGRYPDCDFSNPISPDVALMFYRYSLPKAVRYGSVRIGAQGKACTSGTADNAALLMGPDGDETGVVLEPALGTYTTDSTPISSVGSGRTIEWSVIATDSSCYQVRRFVVTWTYTKIEK